MVRDYRDLHCWQRAMDLLVVSHAIALGLSHTDRWTLGGQLCRAAGSVPANIAEGNGRGSRREYIRFLTIAHGSLREVETHLEVGRRLGLVSIRQAEDALTIALETRQMLVRLRKALTRSG